MTDRHGRLMRSDTKGLPTIKDEYGCHSSCTRNGQCKLAQMQPTVLAKPATCRKFSGGSPRELSFRPWDPERIARYRCQFMHKFTIADAIMHAQSLDIRRVSVPRAAVTPGLLFPVSQSIKRPRRQQSAHLTAVPRM